MNYSVKCIYNRTTDKNISVTVPGSKSITARALLISAIAEGKSTLYGAQLSDDCATFLNCLKSLGIECDINGTTITVNGCGGKLSVQNAEINVGSAGTAARFIPAFLAFQKGEFKVTCSEQMKRRPIAPLINTLREVGATFEFLENDNSFPFIIRGTDKPNGSVSVDIGESSQFLSALLISAVCAKKGLEIKVFGSHGLDYVNMTLDMMWSFGVTVDEREGSYFVQGAYSAKKYDIEPDLSAACYFYAMNRILGTNISVKGVMPHSMQGDSKFIELIKTFDGGKVDISSFSDQTLTLSAIAPFFSKPTQIVGVAHIRRQECDRIKAIVENLTALGVKCEEREDGVIIYPATPHGGNITTFGDHRVAMSFAITGLRVEGVVILNAEVCSKTFKNYFEVLDEICEKIAE